MRGFFNKAGDEAEHQVSVHCGSPSFPGHKKESTSEGDTEQPPHLGWHPTNIMTWHMHSQSNRAEDKTRGFFNRASDDTRDTADRAEHKARRCDCCDRQALSTAATHMHWHRLPRTRALLLPLVVESTAPQQWALCKAVSAAA